MKGWYREHYRHTLAAYGVKTSKRAKYKLHGTKMMTTKNGIPITLRGPPGEARIYPVSPNEVKRVVDKMPDKMTHGIKEINFREPGIPATKQDKAWAQYVRSEGRVNIFSQPYDHKKLVFREVEPENINPENANNHMKDYVIKHEIGHHFAIKYMDADNKLLKVEEAIADAIAHDMDPYNKNIVDHFVKEREEVFGEKGTI